MPSNHQKQPHIEPDEKDGNNLKETISHRDDAGINTESSKRIHQFKKVEVSLQHPVFFSGKVPRVSLLFFGLRH